MERSPKRNSAFMEALFRLLGIAKNRQQKHYSQQMSALEKTNAMIEYDMNGNIISANHYFLNLMDYRLTDLQGQHISSITQENHIVWEDIKQGKKHHFELPHLSKGGKEHWFQSSFNIMKDRDNSPCKILECAIDINDQKKVSLKSEYGEIKSNAITDSIIDAFIMIDKIGTIVRFNPAATKEFGYLEKEVIGQNIKILMPEPYYSQHDSYLHNYNTTQIAKIIGKKGREVKAKRKDGTLFVAEINISKMILGKETFFIGTIRNTTEKVEASKNIISGLSDLEETLSSQSSSALEQAASVSEIVAIVEEIKSTSQQTLEKAKNLGNSAEQTLTEGVKGVQSCEALTTAMDVLQKKMQQISTTILSLSDKTQQIGEITDAVADIAKQSKMLALNASIEAAKAGESGKGFAVVASEVKELAERSEVSTARVQKILQDIRKKTEQAVIATEEGTKSVDENINQLEITTNIISVLANVIQDSSIASQQIVSAVKEESIGIEQVVQSIQEIDKVTNQFSAVTAQTKKAILMLNTVAHSLETKTKSE